MAARRLALMILVAILASGCADPPAAPAATSVALTTAPEAVISPDLGSVTGTVFDDELVPIQRAEVAIRELQLLQQSDAQGRFTFNDVPPGSYALIASALGFESQAMKIELAAAEVKSVNFTLKGIAIAEPRLEVQSNILHLTVCAADFLGVCDIGVCDNCIWKLERFKDKPSHFFYEMYGKHAVPHPSGRDGIMSYAYRNAIGGGDLWRCAEDTPTQPACALLPVRMGFNATDYEDVNTLLVYMTCEPQWFCIDEKYENWATFFFDTVSIPADYSAKP